MVLAQGVELSPFPRQLLRELRMCRSQGAPAFRSCKPLPCEHLRQAVRLALQLGVTGRNPKLMPARKQPEAPGINCGAIDALLTLREWIDLKKAIRPSASCSADFV